MASVPHPIPYQGSKRRLAARILELVPGPVEVLYEPFAGSAAVSLAAAARGLAARHVLGDSLAPLVALWGDILERPRDLADRYEQLWRVPAARSRAHYDEVRARFNRDREPAALLYLLARCVKNAVRFNQAGEFNQSPDTRRAGTSPDRMRDAIARASTLLAGRARARAADYEELLAGATPRDLVYMDPPYEGTSGPRDRRYHQGLDRERFIAAVAELRRRRVPLLISLDGRTGDRAHGSLLPASLGLTRLELDAGRSSQATLLGRDERTVESLYVSPGLGR
ncbi:MAG: DNA adenine methylase [Myxococcales bacterium]|nr:MAG: DNA adenine methylase [Myxococcales bacterium]